MSTILIFPDKTELKIDLTESIDPKYSSEPTSQPVESGDNLGDFVSDHITNNPIELSITGIIAGAKQSETHTPQIESFSNRLQKAWSSKELINIQTNNKIYKNFSLTSFNFNQTADSGEDIKLNISLKQIVTAVTQFTTLQTRQPVTKANTSKSVNNRHSPDKNKGKKPTTGANKAQEAKSQSILFKLGKTAGVF